MLNETECPKTRPHIAAASSRPGALNVSASCSTALIHAPYASSGASTDTAVGNEGSSEGGGRGPDGKCAMTFGACSLRTNCLRAQPLISSLTGECGAVPPSRTVCAHELRSAATNNVQGKLCINYKVIRNSNSAGRDYRCNSHAMGKQKPPRLDEHVGRELPVAAYNPWTIDAINKLKHGLEQSPVMRTCRLRARP